MGQTIHTFDFDHGLVQNFMSVHFLVPAFLGS